MLLPSVPRADLRRLYFTTFLLNVLIFAGSCALPYFGFRPAPDLYGSSALTTPVFMGILLLSVGYQAYYNRRLNRVLAIEAPDDRIAQYTRLYRVRMALPLLVSLLTAACLILTARKTFVYYGAFNLFFMLFLFPNIAVVRKELQDDRLEFS